MTLLYLLASILALIICAEMTRYEWRFARPQALLGLMLVALAGCATWWCIGRALVEVGR